MRVIDTAQRAAWLQERRTYLGATDVSAIMGINPYYSPLMVWLDKRGESPERPMTMPQKMGLVLEPIVASLYREETGRRTRHSRLYRMRGKPYLACNPDYEIVGLPWLLECKTGSSYAARNFGAAGTDEVPDHYLTQCQWQMYVTGRVRCDLAVLLGGQEFRVYPVMRDDALIQTMARTADEWWQTYMLSDTPPPIGELDNDLMGELHPADDGSLIQADYEMDEEVRNYRQTWLESRAIKRRIDGHQARIKSYMGEATTLATSLGNVNWKSSGEGKPRRFTVPFSDDGTD